MAVQKMRIKLKAYDHNLVDQSAARIIETVKKSGAKYSGPIPMPTEKEVITILRAVHKYKDAREQFEMRTYKRLIDIASLIHHVNQLKVATSFQREGWADNLGEIEFSCVKNSGSDEYNFIICCPSGLIK